MTKMLVKRLWLEKYMFVAIACGLLGYLLNISASIPSIMAGNMDIVYFHEYAKSWGAFTVLFQLAPAIGCGLVFVEDMRNHHFQYELVRKNKKAYFASRIAVVILIGGGVLVLTFLFAFFLMGTQIPFVENAERLKELQADLRSYIWLGNSPVPFVSFELILAFLSGGLWALTALTVSAFTQNSLVVISSPIIAAQSMNVIGSIFQLPAVVLPQTLFDGYFSISQKPLVEIGCVICIYVVFYGLLGTIFILRARRLLHD